MSVTGDGNVVRRTAHRRAVREDEEEEAIACAPSARRISHENGKGRPQNIKIGHRMCTVFEGMVFESEPGRTMTKQLAA